MAQDLGEFSVVLAQRLHENADDLDSDLPLEGARPLPDPFFQAPHLFEEIAEILVKGEPFFLDLLSHFGVQRAVLLVAQRLAVDDGPQNEAALGHADREPLLLRLLFKLAEQGLLLGLTLLHRPAPLPLIIFALEGLRDVGEQVLQELFHVLSKLLAHTRRQGERRRPVGAPEIMDIHPIVGNGLVRDPALAVIHADRGPARPGNARHVDVESGPVDPQAEVQGAGGPVLAHDARQGLAPLCCLEGENLRVARPFQGFGRELKVFPAHRCSNP